MHRRHFLSLLPALALPAPLWAAPIKLRDLYNKDLSFSDLAQASVGQRNDVAGFMAPPLKAESTFFVLTDATYARA